MPVTPPFWIMQRQVKVEEVNGTTLRLAGPNLPTCELTVVPADQDAGWQAALYELPAGGGQRHLVVANEDVLKDPGTAWQVAFELYRTHVVV